MNGHISQCRKNLQFEFYVKGETYHILNVSKMTDKKSGASDKGQRYLDILKNDKWSTSTRHKQNE